MIRKLERSVLALVALGVATLATAATVTTDKEHYMPGETAIITGSGFNDQATSASLQVTHADGTTGGVGHAPWTVGIVDGSFSTSWYVDPDDSANETFRLTVDANKGAGAWTEFDTNIVAETILTNRQCGEVAYSGLSLSVDGQDVVHVSVNLLAPDNGTIFVGQTNDGTLGGQCLPAVTVGTLNCTPGATCASCNSIRVCLTDSDEDGTFTGALGGERGTQYRVNVVHVDLQGCTAQSHQTYQVQDLAVTGSTSACPVGCQATITAPANIALSTDAGECRRCGVDVGSATVSCGQAAVASGLSDDGCYPVGSTQITWTSPQSPDPAIQWITITDDELPELTIPADVTVECDAVPGLGEASATDNCGILGVELSSETDEEGSCIGSHVITRTWTATDVNLNSVSATQTITVVDTTAPALTLSNQVAQLSLGSCTANAGIGCTALDNCSSATVAIDVPGPYGPGVTNVPSHGTDACGNTADGSYAVTVYSQIVATKFYDSNTNGVQDGNECGISGWTMSAGSSTGLTNGAGDAAFNGLLPGTYSVSEGAAPNATWINTSSTTVSVGLSCPQRVSFGNVRRGAGGGLTLGFWSNKNGQSRMGDGGSDASELQMLRDRNLRKANGDAFDPTAYSGFRTWILDASATNMAYMLSAQMAAMELNVEAGNVNASSLIYAPGTGSANAAGFAPVSAVLSEANTKLGEDGNTPSGDPNRALQEALKNALDQANNNINFVQPSTCSF